MQESNIQILVYIHAALGALALLGGLIAIISKKGLSIHKKGGKLFVYSMIGAGLSALIISLLPNHENPFLFAVGIFSLYFLLVGFRAIQYKSKHLNLSVDKLISIIMILVCLAMLAMALYVYHSLNIVLIVFGVFGIIMAIRNLILFNNIERTRQKWLQMHIGNISGAYIAAVSAFFVVNDILPGVYNWFVPSIFGAFFITYWLIKVGKPNTQNTFNHE